MFKGMLTGRQVLSSLFIFSIIIGTLEHPVLAEEHVSEIAVSAEWKTNIPVSSVSINLLFKADGAIALETEKTLLAKSNQTLKALRSLDSEIKIEKGYPEFRAATASGSRIPQNAAISGKLRMEITSKQLSLLAKLIDGARASGCDTISSIEFSGQENSDQYLAAIRKAVAIAKQKAQSAAEELGVQLGKVISTVVTQESSGAQLMRARQKGGIVSPPDEQQKTILVNVRFALISDDVQNPSTPLVN